MEPRELVRKLMEREGVNPNSLADALRGKISQPQIHKFISGKVKEPRRTTLKPLADHYGLPLDALFDKEMATAIAIKRGFLPEVAHAAPPPQQVDLDQVQDDAGVVEVTLSEILKELSERLIGRSKAVKNTAAALLSELAQHPDKADECIADLEDFLGRVAVTRVVREGTKEWIPETPHVLITGSTAGSLHEDIPMPIDKSESRRSSKEREI